MLLFVCVTSYNTGFQLFEPLNITIYALNSMNVATLKKLYIIANFKGICVYTFKDFKILRDFKDFKGF